jgi:nucleoid-associated protein YgaU
MPMKIYEENQKSPEFNITAWDRSRQRLHAGAILFAACAIAAGAPPLWAQDVAEVARQAQARKHQQTKHKKHVYTEEDLKRARILTHEDQELLAAKKRDAVLPGAEVATTLDAQTLEHLPLGDVARMYRGMKELNHSQTGAFAEYHLPVTNAALAYAKPEFVAPRPNAVEPTTHNAPAAPLFPNPDLNALRLNTPLVLPTPIVPAPTPNRTTAAHAISISRTIAAKTMFAVSKPNMPGAVGHEIPVAPVFANPEVVSLPAPGFVAPNTQPTLVAPAISNASAPRSIIVKYGDSLWKLAQINLGDGHRWHELAAINPGIVNPEHILPGTPINIAATAPVAATAPNDSNVTVRKGDSLWKIAQKKLGFGGFWGCIAKANPVIQDANLIYTGQILAVPEACDSPSTK